MLFKPDVLLRRVKKLSYPRLVGTHGEEQALDDIKAMLDCEGFSGNEIREHACRVSRFYGKWFVQIITGTMAGLFAGMLCARSCGNVHISVVFIILLIIAIVIFYIKKDGLDWKTDQVIVRTLYTSMPAKQNKKGTIVLGCHIDSKGQVYPLLVRVILFIIAAVCGGIFLALYILNSMTLVFNNDINYIVKSIEQMTGWLGFVALLLLTFNSVNNWSCGAADNASGISVITELAGYYKAEGGLENYELICVFFNAEELGVLGSAQWIKDYGKNYDPQSSYMINFDMVGDEPIMYMDSSGILKKKTNNEINRLLATNAAKLSMPIKSFWMPVGAMTDSMSFRKAGWEACDIVSKELARKAHTKNDVPEAINGKVLADVCLLTRECIASIDRGDSF